MKTKLKLSLTTILLSLAALAFCLFALNTRTHQVLADGYYDGEGTFEMVNEANLRLNADGYSFKAKMDKTQYEGILEDGNKNVYFIIIPSQYKTNVGENYYKSIKRYTSGDDYGKYDPSSSNCIYVEAGAYVMGDYYYLQAGVGNVLAENRKSDYFAVAAIETYNTSTGKYSYVYANFPDDGHGGRLTEMPETNIYNVVSAALYDTGKDYIPNIDEVYTGWYGTEDYPVPIDTNTDVSALSAKLSTYGTFLSSLNYEVGTDVTSEVSDSLTAVTYTIQWKNEDGTLLKTDKLAYGETPSYDGSTPTKSATKQYSYSFDAWTPTITDVTGSKVYTASYTSTVNQYTVTVLTSPAGYGSVDISSVTKDYDTAISTSSNTLTVGNTTVTATPTPATKEYTYSFGSWSGTSAKLLDDMNVTANFTRAKNSYWVSFDTDGGSTVDSQFVEYGSTASKPSNPTKSGYVFVEWQKDGEKFEFSTQITDTTELTAVWITIDEAAVVVTGMSSVEATKSTRDTVSVATAGIGQPSNATNNVSELTRFTEVDGDGQLRIALKTPYLYSILEELNPTDVVRTWMYVKPNTEDTGYQQIIFGTVYATAYGEPDWGVSGYGAVRTNTYYQWETYRTGFVCNRWIAMDVTVAELISGKSSIANAAYLTYFVGPSNWSNSANAAVDVQGHELYIHSVELVRTVELGKGNIYGLEWVNNGNAFVESPKGIPADAASDSTTVAKICRRSSTAASATGTVTSADVYNLIRAIPYLDANAKIGIWIYCDDSDTSHVYNLKVTTLTGAPNDQSPSSYTSVVEVTAGSWQRAEISVGELQTILSAQGNNYLKLAFNVRYAPGGTMPATNVYLHSVEYIPAA